MLAMLCLLVVSSEQNLHRLSCNSIKKSKKTKKILEKCLVYSKFVYICIVNE